jgi:hypothetical protein
MKTEKEIYKWLKNNCGDKCLAPLTSSDAVALVTSVNLSNLVSYESAPEELFAAYRAVVMAMQPHTRYLAYHAIACELDWGHRAMIWAVAELPEGDKPSRKANWESGGSERMAA